jgi:hypothetical protein
MYFKEKVYDRVYYLSGSHQASLAPKMTKYTPKYVMQCNWSEGSDLPDIPWTEPKEKELHFSTALYGFYY